MSVSPAPVRYGGQWIIGTSLGLYFTPQVVREVAGLWYSARRGRACSPWRWATCRRCALARIARLDRTTALFASVPGGAAEMAVLGERFGARVDRVAAAQSLRILIVVADHSGGLHAARACTAPIPTCRARRSSTPAGFVLLMTATASAGSPSIASGFPTPLCWARSPSRFR